MKPSRHIAAVLVGCVLAVAAGAAPGDASLAFLKVGVDARAVAMGEAQIAVPRGASTLYWNPGALSDLQSFNVTAMHNIWLEGSWHDYFSIAAAFEKAGTFAGSANYFNSGLMRGFDEKGLPCGDFYLFDLVGSIGYGHSLLEKRLHLGGAVNILYERNDDQSGKSVSFDLGGLYRFPMELALGLVAKNLGPGIAVVDKQETLPTMVGAGIGYCIPVLPVYFGGDLFYNTASKFQFALGAEATFWDMVSVRLGYRHAYTMHGFSGLRTGVGFQYKGFAVDYAIAPFGQLGLSHRFSLSYVGHSEEEAPEEDVRPPVDETVPEEHMLPW
jgi:hypothetical protein